ncbi:hypothetical protein CEXT_397391 [Caerostris extrusa]|uniref:Uncharacterized protein n=1 Tax=Caerostris extrusa TaxID=172846 RepID=A0AAV4Q593_CAEEX|nr:hypothetical protein CEXT_397391 [Caerostris extrusa]
MNYELGELSAYGYCSLEKCWGRNRSTWTSRTRKGVSPYCKDRTILKCDSLSLHSNHTIPLKKGGKRGSAFRKGL